MRTPLFLVIDLFCGAGGTSTGFDDAELYGQRLAKLIACVNHDKFAIKSHRLNHKQVKHFREDIRTLDVERIRKLLLYYKERYPDAYIVLWSSLECTNFSWAKGGKPRDPDSRTLANHLIRYIKALQPDYVMIENVTEFMAWGPLDNRGRPISKKNGLYWLQWRKEICEQFNYIDAWSEINSANLGAYTSRNRLFGIFAKPGLPIAFPSATHAKNAEAGSLFFDKMPTWRPVREVLDFSLKGTSLFDRPKPLSDRTLLRIFKGLKRYIGAEEKRMDRFISLYYGNGANYTIGEPLPTITTKDRAALISIQYQPTEATSGFIYNPAWSSNASSLKQPCCVVVARQDKAPRYLVTTHLGKRGYPKRSTDSAIAREIMQFMDAHGIADISLRMLSIPELLRIQGFPAGYKLAGSATQQKKFIGNAVVPLVVKAWAEALASKLVSIRHPLAA